MTGYYQSVGRYSTLHDWLSWQETLHPNVIDLGLARIYAVACTLLGDDFNRTKPLTITVAGTNGKGSCVKTLSVLLQAMGKRVGAFSSPHLLRYNERICIDNAEVSDDDLCEAFAAIDTARADTSLTYFEFNALAALWLFRKYRVEVQVLEVGLGGRLDAVNILDADMAVITNIALDHVDWLGDTRDKIGAEKAGILRPHAKLVYGEADMPASIRACIAEQGIACRQLGVDFSVVQQADGWLWQGLNHTGDVLQLLAHELALPAPSVACALQVLAWLNLWDAATVADNVSGLTLPGRFESACYQNRQFIFDVAHNAAGAEYLAKRLQENAVKPLLIFSAMADKDSVSVLRALLPAVSGCVLVPLYDNPRAASSSQLASDARAAGFADAAVTVCACVTDALEAIFTSAEIDAVLVCGSFFTVAAAKECLRAYE